jgi:hypothetical protein
MPTGVNISPQAISVTADTEFSGSYAAHLAVDENLTTKWCSTDTTAEHWLTLGFDRKVIVSGAVIKHAGSGGEWADFNTQAFTIDSADYPTGPWTTQMTGSNPLQHDSTTLVLGTPQRMRYVRLHITDAGIDNYARIYEFEVWGEIPPIPGDFDHDGDVDQVDFGLFQRCYAGAGVSQTDPQCDETRLDTIDDDVDLDDFGIFQGCTSGPNIPADPMCHEP